MLKKGHLLFVRCEHSVWFFLFLVLIGFQAYLYRNTLKKDAIDILAFDADLQEQID